MSAKIYTPPVEAGPVPAVTLDGNWRAVEAAYVARVQALAKRAHPRDRRAGLVFSWPVADGYAQYVVWSSRPLALVHLPLGDAWHMPDVVARGLRVSDIRQSQRASALFARKATA